MSFLDTFVLGASVLEPDLDLCVSESKRLRQFTTAWSCHVLDALVLDLQLQSLLSTERCPLATCYRLMMLLLLLLLLLLLMMMMTMMIVILVVTLYSCSCDTSNNTFMQR